MIRRWLAPLIVGLVLAFASYHVALVQAPRLIMAAAVKRVAALTGFNRMTATPLATDTSRAIVRPSPDLAYSSCPFDLTDGPLLIDVAPVPAPYWSLSVFDARTDVAFVRNNRQSGGKPIHVAVALAGQSVPAGTETVRVAGAKGVALIRILVDDRARFPAIDAARRASSCRPLTS